MLEGTPGSRNRHADIRGGARPSQCHHSRAHAHLGLKPANSADAQIDMAANHTQLGHDGNRCPETWGAKRSGRAILVEATGKRTAREIAISEDRTTYGRVSQNSSLENTWLTEMTAPLLYFSTSLHLLPVSGHTHLNPHS